MTIQWFPGHMAKARKQVQERLKQVDLVLEIVDARVPISSSNPMLNQIIQQKPKLVVLNKADLADPQQTKLWQQVYEEQGHAAVAIDAQHTNRIPQIQKQARLLLADKLAKKQARGIQDLTIRAMCIGIPNVGKSTILNRLIHKNVAVTGNKPGVTKNQQWLKSGDLFELLDTPGILWPKFDDELVGQKLALTGAVADAVFHPDDVALFALNFFTQYHPKRLQKAYNLTAEDLTLSNVDLLLKLTRKLGMKDDFDRMSVKLIQDCRQGRLGTFTLDRPPVSTEE